MAWLRESEAVVVAPVALHIAARRDFVEVSESLLAGGANIEARDSLGETPLRRAVNSAARTGAMRSLL